MKILIVGSLSKDDVKELHGTPVVVLSGSLEDIRRCGGHLYKEVELVERIAPTQAEGAE